MTINWKKNFNGLLLQSAEDGQVVSVDVTTKDYYQAWIYYNGFSNPIYHHQRHII
jgi:hypothetical protein